MSLDNIFVGDYGQIFSLTVKDPDTGLAADLSSYAANQKMIFLKPASSTEIEKAAYFETDGSDGVVQYVLENGFIDTPGTWRVRCRVQGVSALLSTTLAGFFVAE